MTDITQEMAQALASPFSDSDVKWKPQVTTKGRDKQPIIRNGQQVAGCTAHIDARSVMDRLDEVVGVGNWQDSYAVLPNGKNVECTLTVCGVSKVDVGQPNEGGFADFMKGAYSDALKRAAVKFGIGRYLYDMEMEWLPYDGYKLTGKPSGNRSQAKPRAKQNGNGSKKPAVNANQQKPSADQMKQLHTAGRSFYGDAWDETRPKIVKYVTDGRATSSKHLTLAEWQSAMDGIKQKADAA